MKNQKGLRPFVTLGLKPFLFASKDDLAKIQKKYLLLSRDVHPDRVSQDDDEKQDKAESASAKLNLDFSKIRDFWKLAESVLAECLDPTSCPVRTMPSAPPELAAEYFELQETLADLGPTSPQAKKMAHDFSLRVTELLSQREATVMKFAQRFPYSGFGASDVPWTQDDLIEFKELMEQVRYYRSFLRDIKAKFA